MSTACWPPGVLILPILNYSLLQTASSVFTTSSLAAVVPMTLMTSDIFFCKCLTLPSSSIALAIALQKSWGTIWFLPTSTRKLPARVIFVFSTMTPKAVRSTFSFNVAAISVYEVFRSFPSSVFAFISTASGFVLLSL